jgi:hypothetical protein
VVVGSDLAPSATRADASALLVAERLDPARHRYLDDHQLSGKPVFPVAMMAELFARAARGAGVPSPTVNDLRLLKGVVLDGPKDVAVWATGGGGGLRLELRGADGTLHASATAVSTSAPGDPGLAPIEGEAGPAPEAIYPDLLFHGPRFQGIRAVEAIGREELRVRLSADPCRAAWIDGATPGPFAIDPLALDGVFQAMVLWTRRFLGAPSLPSRVGAVAQHVERLPAEVIAHIALRESSETTALADAELRDEAGTVLARVEGYACTASPTLERAYRNGHEE